jgi:siderophore synthetase component
VNPEQSLSAAIVDTLLRENYGGLSDFVISGSEVAPPRVTLPGAGVVGLVADGFLGDYRVDRASAGLTLGDVDAVVGTVADPRDGDGVAAFRTECREALAAMRLRDQHPVRADASYETLAARLPHPAYPTWACRSGWSDDDSLRYGPEFSPEFSLAWAAVPRALVTRSGQSRPPWWPGFDDVGLPASLADGHDLFPVHPRVAAHVDELELVAPLARVRVRPTLSVRTVEVLCAPGTQLKLPLATSTLGLRNNRAIAPGTLADGALVRRTLARILAQDPSLAALLLADDTNYAHARHRYLGYMLRLLPAREAIPVAALLAPRGDRLVIEELADGDLLGWFGWYCSLVFGIAVRLFVRYGIALESHQQNAALVHGHLLIKDFDGALINYPRLVAALGPAAPGRAEFADERLLTESDDDLANVFITITVHLCTGAIAFGLAERGRAALPVLLSIVRESMVAALAEYGGSPGAALLGARVLAAGRLPGKAMLTAGTLVDKARTGASDINKYYGTTGPNYLR